MECASAYVDLNCDEEEEVDFAEEENLLDRGSFQHVAKSKTSSSSSSSSPSNVRGPQPTQQKRRRVRKANTNIIQISLGTLTEDATVSTGDPLFCNKCGVAFSHLDVLKLRKSEEEAQSSSSTSSSSSSSESTTSTSSEGKGKDQAEVGQWKCSFCDTVQDLPLDEEELPKEESMDYILEPPSEGSAQQASDSNSNLIFCIDISGSMCVATEIQGKHQLKGAEHRKKLAALNTEGADQWTRGERRDITYVSRLQSVQAAVDAQLGKLQQEHPNRRVGIVTFNNEVTIIGDGTQIPTTITGDKLYDYSQLLDLGRAHSLRTPIKESKSSLSDKLFGLEEGGATALGPALVVSIGLAGENPGSEVVICTDGLSNVGLGQLDEVNTAEKRGEVELFYQQLGNYAKSKGVTINVISIKGTDCSMENLGTLAELTNGEVNIVDPLTITQEFSSILSQPTIATQVGVKLVLHRGLFIRDDEEDDSAQKKESHIERDVGNVTADSSFTFEFGVRTQEEMAKLNVDTTNISTLPFQLQIRYTKLNGMKCMRVISKQQQVTYDKKLAEQEANVEVIGRNCVQQAAKIAQRGDYTRARLHNFAHMQILDRTAQSDSKRAVASKWGEQQGKFEKKMNKVQVKEKQEGLLLDDDEEGEANEVQSEKREVRSVARKARRDDKTAKMLWNLRSKRNK